MTPIRFTALAAIFALASEVHADTLHLLRFQNGDEITGSPLAIDLEEVIWDSPALETPARLQAENIRDLRLPWKIHIPESTVGHEATVTLTNDDVVRGQLASVTEEEVMLDTWYAGRMVFRRPMVRDLSIREMPDYIYRGPGSIGDWMQSAEPHAWAEKTEGGFISSGPGSIGKELALPEEFTLEFSARWQGSFRLNVILFSDDPGSDSPDNGYELTFQRQSIHLRRCGQRVWIGHTNRATDLQQNEKARIRIRASSRTGRVAVYVNDTIIDVWTDDNIEAENLGSAIHFVSPDNSPVRVSRIDLSSWNGVLNEKPDGLPLVGRGIQRRGMGFEDPEEEPEEPDDGSMILRNGDRISGTVNAIQDGQITIQTSFREITLPVERLRTVVLKPVDLEKPKLENGDIRAWFTDGGSIVFRLDGVTDDGAAVQGYSQTFGNAMFDITAFKRLEFNIYDFLGADF